MDGEARVPIAMFHFCQQRPVLIEEREGRIRNPDFEELQLMVGAKVLPRISSPLALSQTHQCPHHLRCAVADSDPEQGWAGSILMGVPLPNQTRPGGRDYLEGVDASVKSN